MATLKNTTVSDTGAVQLPVGTTAQRPGSPSAGQMRYNSSFKTVETYDGSRWRYMPDIVRNGLVLHLDAGEPSSYPGSGTTWTDLSGNGNNGTLNGPTYSSSNGGYFSFDGVDDYVNTPLVTSSTTNVTMQVLVNITSTSLKGIIIANGSGNGYCLGVGSNTADNLGNERLMLFPGVRWIDTNTNYGTGWKLLTMSLDSTSIPSLTEDTTLIGSYPGTAPGTPSTGTYLGRSIGDEPGGNRAFGGYISIALMYNRVLTPKEIKQNYEALRGRFGI